MGPRARLATGGRLDGRRSVVAACVRLREASASAFASMARAWARLRAAAALVSSASALALISAARALAFVSSASACVLAGASPGLGLLRLGLRPGLLGAGPGLLCACPGLGLLRLGLCCVLLGAGPVQDDIGLRLGLALCECHSALLRVEAERVLGAPAQPGPARTPEAQEPARGLEVLLGHLSQLEPAHPLVGMDSRLEAAADTYHQVVISTTTPRGNIPCRSRSSLGAPPLHSLNLHERQLGVLDSHEGEAQEPGLEVFPGHLSQLESAHPLVGIDLRLEAAADTSHQVVISTTIPRGNIPCRRSASRLTPLRRSAPRGDLHSATLPHEQ